MTDRKSAAATAWGRLSSRERTLVAVATAIIAVLAGVYLGLLPGLDAARSAESRRRLAATDLQEIRQLAAQVERRSLQAQKAAGADQAGALRDIAAGAQVTLIDNQAANGVRVIRILAPTSESILAFAASAAEELGTGVGSMAISRGDGRALSATLSFGSTGS